MLGEVRVVLCVPAACPLAVAFGPVCAFAVRLVGASAALACAMASFQPAASVADVGGDMAPAPAGGSVLRAVTIRPSHPLR